MPGRTSLTATIDPLSVSVAPPWSGTGMDRWYAGKRIAGLARFATAITVLNIAGHLFLGFEQSWVTPLVALATSYLVELFGESMAAVLAGRPTRYSRSLRELVYFLLPAHISGLAVGMLLYAADQLWAVVFAASVAIASKYVFRIRLGRHLDGRPVERHFLNPSNCGIALTLLLFPTVGVAPPYQFSENTFGLADWLIPLLVILLGSLLNTLFTERVPLILAWIGGFAAQAIARALLNETPWLAGLMPMTGFAFILFSLYMITDPATTPARWRDQIMFGFACAGAYALLMELHVVFGLFFALLIVSLGRGLLLILTDQAASMRAEVSVRGKAGVPAKEFSLGRQYGIGRPMGTQGERDNE